ncbi:MAG: efflux RND transporter periplasmic adaptor subunit [Defluviicoccus sp.]|nr:efflux RND transporter periplasmic adaptor subunit [Defluviicoccus sp.]
MLYYKDPMGGPDTSPVPKKDSMGMDYLPVYADEQPNAQATSPAPPKPVETARGDRKPLYYRNPMGLPDTSPVPKKDSMGMDYIPVFAEDVEAAAQGFVKISPERVQMIGVQSEAASRRNLVRPLRAVGSVQFDERRTYVVSTRYEGWIEKLLVKTTGEKVRRGQPLMEIYSPDLVLAQQEYSLLRQSIDESGGGETAATSRRLLEGAEQRLRYLDFPAAALEHLRAGGAPRASVTMPSPVSGTVIDKPSVQGMRFMPGEPLYRIVDMSTVWLIAEIFEQDLAGVRVGQSAAITVKAYPGRSFTGRVAFIYPVVGEQTRTARVRIEMANPDDLLKADMYASVEIASPVGPRDVLAIPESAVIDSGARQIVLIDHGDGRFEPRAVKLGDRAEGYVAVIDGVRADERVVVSANFLIDAESNLKAALSSFAGGGHQHQ